MNKAIFNITDFAPHYYNVHILTDGAYTGVGRFCETEKEMINFCLGYHVTEITNNAGYSIKIKGV